MTTFSDTVAYIADRASLEDLDLFSQAGADRRNVLAEERMNALTTGDAVRTDQLKDDRLNRLEGTISSISRNSPLGAQATIDLDAASTWRLQGHEKYFDRIPNGATTFPLLIPLSCVFPL